MAYASAPMKQFVDDRDAISAGVRDVLADLCGGPTPTIHVAYEQWTDWTVSCSHPTEPGKVFEVTFPTRALEDMGVDRVVSEVAENLGNSILIARHGAVDASQMYTDYLKRKAVVQKQSNELQAGMLRNLVPDMAIAASAETDPVPTLHPYQEDGVAHLLSGRFRYLSDGMGLGKTVQAIVAVNESGADSVAVICPAGVVPNWEHEWGVWGDQDITFEVHSYASRAVRERSIDADIIVLDEVHYCKNRKAKRSANALAIATRADRAFLLSGTPGRNMADLWTIFDAFWPELLSSEIETYDGWLHYFCKTRPVKITPYKTIPKITGHRPEHVAEGKTLLGEVMLRRELDDVNIEIPALRIHMHRFPLDANIRDELDNDPAARDIARDPGSHDPGIGSLRNRLGQMKAPLVAEVIASELDRKEYDKIVIGYHHRATGDELERGLKQFGVVRLDGLTLPSERGGVQREFRKNPDVRVFLGQMQSAGEGLNLQVASEIALVEPAWTADPNRQFIKRIHRIGQDSPCRARIFCVAGTLDEQIMQNILRDATMQEEVGLR